MRPSAIVGALIVAGAAAATFAWRPPAKPEVSGAGVTAQKPSDPTVPTPAERRQLQAEADSACRCAKQPGRQPRDQQCWAGFERSLARFEHSEGGTACMEESVALTCFPPYDELASSENCIFRERMYGACSEEEVNRRRAEARARGDKGCGD